MKWRYYDTGFNTGKFNMEFDLRLTEECSDDEICFRLYRWKPYCISLGYHQSENEIDLHKTERDGIDIVRRPTGGRAILHSEEITYSIVVPLKTKFSAKEIYSKVSDALIKGLSYYDVKLSRSILESVQPDFPALLATDSGAICFASAAKNEVKIDNRKIIGSAQRKLRRSILQHGSILCGNFHLKLPDYLNTSDDIKQALKSEMREKTASVSDITNKPVNYDELKVCIKQGIEEGFSVNLIQTEIPDTLVI